MEEIKTALKRVTQIKRFKKDSPLRIVCDVSKEGVGAILQQETEADWNPVYFASRFVTPFEQKYSIKELD